MASNAVSAGITIFVQTSRRVTGPPKKTKRLRGSSRSTVMRKLSIYTNCPEIIDHISNYKLSQVGKDLS
jgi:hypothetical protein